MYGYASTYNGVNCQAATLSILSARWRVFSFATNKNTAAVATLFIGENIPANTNMELQINWTSNATTGNWVCGVGILAVAENENYIANSTYSSFIVPAPSSAYQRKVLKVTITGNFSSNSDFNVVVYRHKTNIYDNMNANVLIPSILIRYPKYKI